MDNGCTNQMTHDQELFRELDKSQVIGNGDLITVEGKGTVTIESCASTKLTYDVLYVPEIHQNLLSVGQLIKKGFKVIFENKHYLIKDINDKEIFNIKMKDKSFSFDPLKEEQAAYPVIVNNTEVWHKRLGHFHHADVKEECAISLNHYATNTLNNVDSAMKRASSVYSKQMDQWLSSSKALEVKKMELEIESQFMNESRLELNNTIEHSI